MIGEQTAGVSPAHASGGAPTGAARAFALIERGLLFAGIVLFVVLILRIGLGTVRDHLLMIGWGFAFIIGQEMLAAIANTFGWRSAFAPPRPPIRFRTLLAARIVGDGINCVTPTATIGGEFVRGRYLEGQADEKEVWASVAVAKISQSLAQALFILAGMFLVLDDGILSPAMRRVLVVAVPVFAGLIGLTVVLQRRGLFTSGVHLMRRIGLPVPARVGDALRQLDDEIRRVYAAPGAFASSVAYFLVGWGVGVIEIYLILYFLDVGATWHRALSIEVLSVTIDGILFFVPAKAGTQEGGKMLIFSLLGLDPAKGLSLAIARRIRELTWAGIALLIWRRQRSRKGNQGWADAGG